MARASKRIQPYEAADGDHLTLLRFARQAARRLDPHFDPPATLLERQDTEGMQDVMRFYKRWGDEQHGFETTHTAELEPRASAQMVDRVELSAIGLAGGAKLEMECTYSRPDPRFVELRLDGDEAAVKEILANFEKQFGGGQIGPG